MKGSFLAFLIKVKHFLRENLGAPFILGFQVLLAVCAVLLVFGFSFLAEGVAVIAYFLLVVGAVLQLICFVGDSGEGEADE